MDKAPDAFRTISEVAAELDIPQHVLRFWETRFSQIKPMKRSGGRRYYRPDDVDLLKGIRRLLYGEGYTIRGVQRILKEHGIKSVQRLADSEASATFGAVEEAIGRSFAEEDYEPAPGHGIDLDDDDYEGEDEGLDLHAAMAEPDLRAAPAPAPSRPARPESHPADRHEPRFGAATRDAELDEPALGDPPFDASVLDEPDDIPAFRSHDDEDDDHPLPARLKPPLGPPQPRATPPRQPAVDLAPLRAVLQDLIACREALDAVMKDG
ncbi:MerR family transcriptional regulator [Rhodopseudomonas sp. HC1]|uniref:MerR family transcriptional regulator n=1 Tax=Rhodopseudomonas infernalis TaxID=2897386 RepID=UPI001EE89814|nr:MerR family transcriptional regulator [Rhodopseudomonas infernalis]MCG6204444.1 MerR family transcriptional regulator [Rhodopseudomonas infernalis]